MGILKPNTENRCKRFAEQRWMIDHLINTERLTMSGHAPISTSPRLYTTGMVDADRDLASVSLRVTKFDDICREFERVAAKRERFAKVAEDAGHLVTARDNYVTAALLYGDAIWPIVEDDHPDLIRYAEKKNACYDKVIQYASHPIERVEIPFGSTSLPGLLHLPDRTPDHRWPCLVSIPGMDGFKEFITTMYGDKYLTRGIATLAIDGPGQGDSLLRKIRVTPDTARALGTACYDYLCTRPEIDPDSIALKGISFASLWALQAASQEHRFKAVSAAMPCFEPGCHTIFNKASPTFKLRFMWMAGYDDETRFDADVAAKITWEGYAGQITCPTQLLVGEDDQLSALPYALRLYDALTAPKRLIVYEGCQHNLLGPAAYTHLEWRTLEADWIADRLHDQPMTSKRLYFTANGDTRPIPDQS